MTAPHPHRQEARAGGGSPSGPQPKSSRPPAPRASARAGRPPRPGRAHRVERWLGRHPFGLALTAPYTAFVLVVFAIPFGFGVWMAFHDYFFTAPGVSVPHPFVGFDNFTAVLGDGDTRRAFRNLGVFMAINIPLTVVLALSLAAALNSATRWRVFFRVSYYVPYVTASVATLAVWLFLFNGSGAVNHALGAWAPEPSWLANKHLVMPLIALYVTWKQLGFYVLLYLAALQNVPRELHEAALTDGAGRWQAFRAVTLPAVRPVTSLVILLSLITSGQIFTEPFLLTGGGPNGASLTPALLIYQRGLEQGEPDAAAAIGLILVTAVLILATISRRVMERN
ncbi:sugar ABC transporter permease [Streptomyces sp. WAC 06738]|uniref:carbohydrate ABC transporter permease n=1 Tax=Streptomyces sp. WAC 06738 TaxID=2203210 RepID=UPI000F703ECB|nr:sugar ABC transporter permease [Streptomyces sp. WAC 06738]AZM50465.1 sugar ABC transporter permease [Streptomyces sp. WAC 06738]